MFDIFNEVFIQDIHTMRKEIIHRSPVHQMRSYFSISSEAVVTRIKYAMNRTACILAIFLFGNFNHVFSQNKFAIISDTQAPLSIESHWNKQWNKNEKNVEARTVLFSNLLNENISALFFLGDIVGIGSNNKHWIPIDTFLDSLHTRNIKSYAIAGNHEYMLFSKKGTNNLYKRFSTSQNLIQVQTFDSISVVLLNTNYSHISKKKKNRQQESYKHALDSLQASSSTKKIIVCTHQPPYTNSKKIKSDKEVQQLLVSDYISTPKAVLFISGHSHNLEHFQVDGKNFFVIGGGGGLFQGVKDESECDYPNQIPPDFHLRYFYLLLERSTGGIAVTVKGVNPTNFSINIEKQFLF